MVIFDILIEFIDRLSDRKNYKKRTVDSLKFTAIIIMSVLIVIGLLFIIGAVIVFVRKP
jgi:cytoskeletal protein RodZ